MLYDIKYIPLCRIISINILIIYLIVRDSVTLPNGLANKKRASRYTATTKQELICFYGMHMLIENTYGKLN